MTAALEHVELMERLDFADFKVSIKSTNVPNTIASNRLLSQKIPYPIHLGITEAGHEVVGLAEVRGRPGDAARRRDRRHDPDLALHLPRRGGGQGRLGDPQGAAAARARPGADRLPDVRAPPVRHGHRGGRDRAPPGGLRGPDRGRGPRLRGQRDRRGLPRRLRDHRREERGPDLQPGQAAAQGPQDQLVDMLFEEIDKYATSKRSTSTRARRPRAPSGCARSRTRTPAS